VEATKRRSGDYGVHPLSVLARRRATQLGRRRFFLRKSSVLGVAQASGGAFEPQLNFGIPAVLKSMEESGGIFVQAQRLELKAHQLRVNQGF